LIGYAFLWTIALGVALCPALLASFGYKTAWRSDRLVSLWGFALAVTFGKSLYLHRRSHPAWLPRKPEICPESYDEII
jgi:hypothetical protein